MCAEAFECGTKCSGCIQILMGRQRAQLLFLPCAVQADLVAVRGIDQEQQDDYAVHNRLEGRTAAQINQTGSKAGLTERADDGADVAVGIGGHGLTDEHGQEGAHHVRRAGQTGVGRDHAALGQKHGTGTGHHRTGDDVADNRVDIFIDAHLDGILLAGFEGVAIIAEFSKVEQIPLNSVPG